jgi:hypothetical protein
MPMSAEARAAASQRMKDRHAAKRNGSEPSPQDILIPPLEPPVAVRPNGVFGIHIDVNWERLPMQEARLAYAELKAQFEKAGYILNSRSGTEQPSYVCFICKKAHAGLPAFRDFAGWKDPVTNLIVPVGICGTICYEKYNRKLFEKRRDENQRTQER